VKILQGKRAGNFQQAVALAFQEAGIDDMSHGVTDLFTAAVEASTLGSEAEKAIAATIRGKYRNKPEWESKWWRVPVPVLHYDTRDVPHITFEVKMYLVAVVEVETSDDVFTVTLVEATVKPETVIIPMVFLQAVLDDDLGRFRLVAKNSSHSTWDIPGTRTIRLPNDFTNKLGELLKRKSIAMWLEGFGSQGRSISPLVVGSLLGLEFQGTAQTVPLGRQPWTTEQLVKALEGMAYPASEAKEMFNRAAPNLRADHTFEEALRIVLQKGEQL